MPHRTLEHGTTQAKPWDRVLNWLRGTGEAGRRDSVEPPPASEDGDFVGEIDIEPSDGARRFRSRVRRHEAHPLEREPGEASDPTPPPPVSEAGDEDRLVARAARDPLGRGMAERMIDSALGGDPDAIESDPLPAELRVDGEIDLDPVLEDNMDFDLEAESDPDRAARRRTR